MNCAHCGSYRNIRLFFYSRLCDVLNFRFVELMYHFVKKLRTLSTVDGAFQFKYYY
jgi:hypothetical protein